MEMHDVFGKWNEILSGKIGQDNAEEEEKKS